MAEKWSITEEDCRVAQSPKDNWPKQAAMMHPLKLSPSEGGGGR